MASFSSVEEAEKFFTDDRFAVENGIVIDELGEDWCVCSMEIAPRHMNAGGIVNGGAVFTLADFAAAVAWNNMHKYTVSQQASISFLRATRGKKLIARAQCRKEAKNSVFFDILVKDDLGAEIAQLTMIGCKL